MDLIGVNKDVEPVNELDNISLEELVKRERSVKNTNEPGIDLTDAFSYGNIATDLDADRYGRINRIIPGQDKAFYESQLGYDQGFLEEMGTAAINFAPGVAGMMTESVGAVGELLMRLTGNSGGDYTNAVIELGQDLQNWGGELYKKDPAGSWSDSAYAVEVLGGLVESMVAFGLTGAGTGAALSKGAKETTRMAAAIASLKAVDKGQDVVDIIKKANSIKDIQKGLNVWDDVAKKMITPNESKNIIANNMKFISDGIDAGARVTNSAMLSYLEGHSTANSVYKDVFNKKYDELIAQGLSTEEAYQKAHELGGESADMTLYTNVFAGTLLNMGAMTPFMNTRAFRKYGGVDPNKTVKQMAEELGEQGSVVGQFMNKVINSPSLRYTMGREAVQESLEEGANFVAEGVGKGIGDGKGYFESLSESTHKLFTTGEGWEAMLLGALGGVGQTGILDVASKYTNERNTYEETILDSKTGRPVQKDDKGYFYLKQDEAELNSRKEELDNIISQFSQFAPEGSLTEESLPPRLREAKIAIEQEIANNRVDVTETYTQKLATGKKQKIRGSQFQKLLDEVTIFNRQNTALNSAKNLEGLAKQIRDIDAGKNFMQVDGKFTTPEQRGKEKERILQEMHDIAVRDSIENGTHLNFINTIQELKKVKEADAEDLGLVKDDVDSFHNKIDEVVASIKEDAENYDKIDQMYNWGEFGQMKGHSHAFKLYRAQKKLAEVLDKENQERRDLLQKLAFKLDENGGTNSQELVNVVGNNELVKEQIKQIETELNTLKNVNLNNLQPGERYMLASQLGIDFDSSEATFKRAIKKNTEELNERKKTLDSKSSEFIEQIRKLVTSLSEAEQKEINKIFAKYNLLRKEYEDKVKQLKKDTKESEDIIFNDFKNLQNKLNKLKDELIKLAEDESSEANEFSIIVNKNLDKLKEIEIFIDEVLADPTYKNYNSLLQSFDKEINESIAALNQYPNIEELNNILESTLELMIDIEEQYNKESESLYENFTESLAKLNDQYLSKLKSLEDDVVQAYQEATNDAKPYFNLLDEITKIQNNSLLGKNYIKTIQTLNNAKNELEVLKTQEGRDKYVQSVKNYHKSKITAELKADNVEVETPTEEQKADIATKQKKLEEALGNLGTPVAPPTNPQSEEDFQAVVANLLANNKILNVNKYFTLTQIFESIKDKKIVYNLQKTFENQINKIKSVLYYNEYINTIVKDPNVEFSVYNDFINAVDNKDLSKVTVEPSVPDNTYDDKSKSMVIKYDGVVVGYIRSHEYYQIELQEGNEVKKVNYIKEDLAAQVKFIEEELVKLLPGLGTSEQKKIIAYKTFLETVGTEVDIDLNGDFALERLKGLVTTFMGSVTMNKNVYAKIVANELDVLKSVQVGYSPIFDNKIDIDTLISEHGDNMEDIHIMDGQSNIYRYDVATKKLTKLDENQVLNIPTSVKSSNFSFRLLYKNNREKGPNQPWRALNLSNPQETGSQLMSDINDTIKAAVEELKTTDKDSVEIMGPDSGFRINGIDIGNVSLKVKYNEDLDKYEFFLKTRKKDHTTTLHQFHWNGTKLTNIAINAWKVKITKDEADKLKAHSDFIETYKGELRLNFATGAKKLNKSEGYNSIYKKFGAALKAMEELRGKNNSTRYTAPFFFKNANVLYTTNLENLIKNLPVNTFNNATGKINTSKITSITTQQIKIVDGEPTLMPSVVTNAVPSYSVKLSTNELDTVVKPVTPEKTPPTTPTTETYPEKKAKLDLIVDEAEDKFKANRTIDNYDELIKVATDLDNFVNSQGHISNVANTIRDIEGPQMEAQRNSIITQQEFDAKLDSLIAELDKYSTLGDISMTIAKAYEVINYMRTNGVDFMPSEEIDQITKVYEENIKILQSQLETAESTTPTPVVEDKSSSVVAEFENALNTSVATKELLSKIFNASNEEYDEIVKLVDIDEDAADDLLDSFKKLKDFNTYDDKFKKSFVQLLQGFADNIKTYTPFKSEDTLGTNKVSKEEILKEVSEIVDLNKLSIGEIDSLFTNLNNHQIPIAAYNRGILYLGNNMPMGTGYHEAFHVVFRGILSDSEVGSYLRLAKNEWGVPTKKDLEKLQSLYKETIPKNKLIQLWYEEKLADAFEEYAVKSKTQKTWIQKLINKILNFFKGREELSELEQNFKNILNGEYKNSRIKYGRVRPIAFKTLDTIIKVGGEKVQGTVRNRQTTALINTIAGNIFNTKNLNYVNIGEYQIQQEINLYTQYLKNTIKSIKSSGEKSRLIDEKINKLRKIVNALKDPDNEKILKEEILRVLNVYKDINNTEDVNESLFIQEGTKIDHFEALNKKMKMKLALIQQEYDLFELGDFSKYLDDNIKTFASDGQFLYHRISSLLLNIPRENMLSIIKDTATWDPEVKLFYNWIKREITKEIGNIDNLTHSDLSKSLEYNLFTNSFEYMRLISNQTVIDKDGTIKVIDLVKQAAVDSQIKEWNSNFNVNNNNRYDAKNKTKNLQNVYHLLKNIKHDNHFEAMKVFIDALKESIGVELSVGTVRLLRLHYKREMYDVNDSKSKDLTPEETKLINKYSHIDLKTAFGHLKTMAINLGDGQSPYVPDKDGEKDENFQTRLKQIAEVNAQIDTSLGSSTYQNFDNENVWDRIKPGLMTLFPVQAKARYGKVLDIIQDDKIEDKVQEIAEFLQKDLLLPDMVIAKDWARKVIDNPLVLNIENLDFNFAILDGLNSKEGFQSKGEKFTKLGKKDLMFFLMSLYENSKNKKARFNTGVNAEKSIAGTFTAERVDHTRDSIIKGILRILESDYKRGRAKISIEDLISQGHKDRIDELTSGKLRGEEQGREYPNFNTLKANFKGLTELDITNEDHLDILKFLGYDLGQITKRPDILNFNIKEGGENLFDKEIRALNVESLYDLGNDSNLYKLIDKFIETIENSALDILDQGGTISKIENSNDYRVEPNQAFPDSFKDGVKLNKKQFVNFIWNDFFMGTAYNEMMMGDISSTHKSVVDIVKRASGINANGGSVYDHPTKISITNDVVYDNQGEEDKFKMNADLDEDAKQEATDAQAIISAQYQREIYINQGKIVRNSYEDKLLQNLIRGIPITDYDSLYNRGIVMNILKLVYFDGTTYFKLGARAMDRSSIMSFDEEKVDELNALWDDLEGTRLQSMNRDSEGISDIDAEYKAKMNKIYEYYTAIPGKEDDFNKMKAMDLNNIQMDIYKSGSKKFQVLLNNISDEEFGIKDGSYYNGKMMREQVATDSYKTKITSPTQKIPILAGTKNAEELTSRFKNLLAERLKISYDEMNVKLLNNGDINWIKMSELFLNSLEANSSSSKLKELFTYEMGKLKGNPDIPLMFKKFQDMAMSILQTNSIQQKQSGGKLTLAESTGTKVWRSGKKTISTKAMFNMGLTPVNGVIEYEGDEYKLERLKHALTDENNQMYSEIVISEQTLDSMGLTIKDVTDENGKITMDLRMFGVRIPTQGPVSMAYLKVVDILPRSEGNIALVPVEINYLSGADFDIDSLYVESIKYYRNMNNQLIKYGVNDKQDYAHKVVKEGISIGNNETELTLIKKLEDEINEEKLKIEAKKSELNSKGGKKKDLINSYEIEILALENEIIRLESSKKYHKFPSKNEFKKAYTAGKNSARRNESKFKEYAKEYKEVTGKELFDKNDYAGKQKLFNELLGIDQSRINSLKEEISKLNQAMSEDKNIDNQLSNLRDSIRDKRKEIRGLKYDIYEKALKLREVPKSIDGINNQIVELSGDLLNTTFNQGLYTSGTSRSRIIPVINEYYFGEDALEDPENIFSPYSVVDKINQITSNANGLFDVGPAANMTVMLRFLQGAELGIELNKEDLKILYDEDTAQANEQLVGEMTDNAKHKDAERLNLDVPNTGVYALMLASGLKEMIAGGIQMSRGVKLLTSYDKIYNSPLGNSTFKEKYEGTSARVLSAMKEMFNKEYTIDDLNKLRDTESYKSIVFPLNETDNNWSTFRQQISNPNNEAYQLKLIDTYLNFKEVSNTLIVVSNTLATIKGSIKGFTGVESLFENLDKIGIVIDDNGIASYKEYQEDNVLIKSIVSKFNSNPAHVQRMIIYKGILNDYAPKMTLVQKPEYINVLDAIKSNYSEFIFNKPSEKIKLKNALITYIAGKQINRGDYYDTLFGEGAAELYKSYLKAKSILPNNKFLNFIKFRETKGTGNLEEGGFSFINLDYEGNTRIKLSEQVADNIEDGFLVLEDPRELNLGPVNTEILKDFAKRLKNYIYVKNQYNYTNNTLVANMGIEILMEQSRALDIIMEKENYITEEMLREFELAYLLSPQNEFGLLTYDVTSLGDKKGSKLSNMIKNAYRSLATLDVSDIDTKDWPKEEIEEMIAKAKKGSAKVDSKNTFFKYDTLGTKGKISIDVFGNENEAMENRKEKALLALGKIGFKVSKRGVNFPRVMVIKNNKKRQRVLLESFVHTVIKGKKSNGKLNYVDEVYTLVNGVYKSGNKVWDFKENGMFVGNKATYTKVDSIGSRYITPYANIDSAKDIRPKVEELAEVFNNFLKERTLENFKEVQRVSRIGNDQFEYNDGIVTYNPLNPILEHYGRIIYAKTSGFVKGKFDLQLGNKKVEEVPVKESRSNLDIIMKEKEDLISAALAKFTQNPSISTVEEDDPSNQICNNEGIGGYSTYKGDKPKDL